MIQKHCSSEEKQVVDNSINEELLFRLHCRGESQKNTLHCCPLPLSFLLGGRHEAGGKSSFKIPSYLRDPGICKMSFSASPCKRSLGNVVLPGDEVEGWHQRKSQRKRKWREVIRKLKPMGPGQRGTKRWRLKNWAKSLHLSHHKASTWGRMPHTHHCFGSLAHCASGTFVGTCNRESQPVV